MGAWSLNGCLNPSFGLLGFLRFFGKTGRANLHQPDFLRSELPFALGTLKRAARHTNAGLVEIDDLVADPTIALIVLRCLLHK